jgi:hypothetical protein
MIPMADQFFENFQNVVEGPADEAAGAGTAVGTEEAPKKKGWLSRLKG